MLTLIGVALLWPGALVLLSPPKPTFQEMVVLWLNYASSTMILLLGVVLLFILLLIANVWANRVKTPSLNRWPAARRSGLLLSCLIPALGLTNLLWTCDYRAGHVSFGVHGGALCMTVLTSSWPPRLHGLYIDVYPRASRMMQEWENLAVLPAWEPSPTITSISVPLWILFLVVGIPTLLLWWFGCRPLLPGHCHRCDYNLTGNTSGRCPECGWKITKRYRAS